MGILIPTKLYSSARNPGNLNIGLIEYRGREVGEGREPCLSFVVADSAGLPKEYDQEVFAQIRPQLLLDIGLVVYDNRDADTLVLLRLFGPDKLNGKGIDIEFCERLMIASREMGFRYLSHRPGHGINMNDLTLNNPQILLQMGWRTFDQQHYTVNLQEQNF